jgi:hypothetical protein
MTKPRLHPDDDRSRWAPGAATALQVVLSDRPLSEQGWRDDLRKIVAALNLIHRFAVDPPPDALQDIRQHAAWAVSQVLLMFGLTDREMSAALGDAEVPSSRVAALPGTHGDPLWQISLTFTGLAHGPDDTAAIQAFKTDLGVVPEEQRAGYVDEVRARQVRPAAATEPPPTPGA